MFHTATEVRSQLPLFHPKKSSQTYQTAGIYSDINMVSANSDGTGTSENPRQVNTNNNPIPSSFGFNFTTPGISASVITQRDTSEIEKNNTAMRQGGYDHTSGAMHGSPNPSIHTSSTMNGSVTANNIGTNKPKVFGLNQSIAHMSGGYTNYSSDVGGANNPSGLNFSASNFPMGMSVDKLSTIDSASLLDPMNSSSVNTAGPTLAKEDDGYRLSSDQSTAKFIENARRNNTDVWKGIQITI